MNEDSAYLSPISDRSGVTDGVRVQILAAEHWSLGTQHDLEPDI